MLEQDDNGKKPFLPYLAAVFVCGALALGISWVYASTQGIRFLESGYSVWNAKKTLLRGCDLGEVVVFGDSRADSAIIPARLSKTATNLGFAGGTPIENYFFVKSLMSCNVKPGMLVLSFNPNAFEIVQPWLWDNAIRYGMLGWPEISLVRQEAERLGDRSYFTVKPHIGIDGLFRDVAYTSHFPAIYFNSLIESRLMFRKEKNRAKFAEVVHARGYPSYGNGGQIGVIGTQARDTPFAPLLLQKSFFEKTVAMLDNAGIETYFMIAPYSETGVHAHDLGYKTAYLAYLEGVAARYRHFHLLQHQVPVWPNAMFADGQHLNGQGADMFSRQLNRCIKATNTQSKSQSECGMEWIGQTINTADTQAATKIAP